MAAMPGYMRALEVCDIKIVKMPKGECGEIFFQDNLIHISRLISIADQLKTLLHECLHWRWPRRTEQEIVNLESAKWEVLKPYELRAFLEALYPVDYA